MIEEVWRRAAAAARIDRLIVATDDDRVAASARAFGAETAMTSPDHPSGTDRAAEVARTIAAADPVLVIQADEPLLTASSLDRLVDCFDGDDPPALATLAEPLADVEELFDANVVKVVTADDGRALYFSRSPIPYHRGAAPRLETDFREALARRAGGLAGYRKHQGIYGYRREALLTLTGRAPSSLESDEGLEQLRALQAGFLIEVVDSDFRSFSVDTPEDVERVTRMLTEAD